MHYAISHLFPPFHWLFFTSAESIPARVLHMGEQAEHGTSPRNPQQRHECAMYNLHTTCVSSASQAFPSPRIGCCYSAKLLKLPGVLFGLVPKP